ncbi:MAG: hypothetical protein ACOCZX_05030 [Candidatus Bipolaricaulota bacterium]
MPKPPSQSFQGDSFPDSTTFDIMAELSPDLTPGVYQFTVTVTSNCVDGCAEDGWGVYGESITSGVFTLTVFPSETYSCCQPTIQEQLVSTVDPASTAVLARVAIDNVCSPYSGGSDTINVALSLASEVDPQPTAGGMSFTLSPGNTVVSYGGSASVDLVGSFSPDLSSGFYQVNLTVSASCGDYFYETATAAATETFTIYVQPVREERCCYPVLGPQLNVSGVPGQRVPLASIYLSNSCSVEQGGTVSRPRLTVEALTVLPNPDFGRIFLLTVPQQASIPSGDFQRITLYGVLTEDVPEGFYRVQASLKVECTTLRGSQEEHSVAGSFVLSVNQERDRAFAPGPG